jgi:hypothetical protein
MKNFITIFPIITDFIIFLIIIDLFILKNDIDKNSGEIKDLYIRDYDLKKRIEKLENIKDKQVILHDTIEYKKLDTIIYIKK